MILVRQPGFYFDQSVFTHTGLPNSGPSVC
jgi:hypothetical protein